VVFPFLKSFYVNPPDYWIFPYEFYANLLVFFKITGIVFCSLTILLLLAFRKYVLFLERASADRKSFLRDLKQSLSKVWESLKADRHLLVAALVVFLVSVSYRFYILKIRPVGYDEVFSYTFWARKHLLYVRSEYHNVTNQILQTILMHFSAKFFGIQPWALRLPVFLFGRLVLPLVFLVGRALYNQTTAILAMALCGVSGPLVLYSTDGRGYILKTVFFLFMILFAVFLQKKKTSLFEIFLS
jgi:hypothetical protein